jgi:hypothetical protein
MDAKARETGDARADGEVVWFRHLGAGVKLAVRRAGDGGTKADIYPQDM